MLASTTIPVRSSHVVTRNDPDGVILFQSKTDEMHFVSAAAFTLYALCDGSRTVAELKELVATYCPEFGLPEGRAQIEHFLAGLADRRLIEFWG